MIDNTSKIQRLSNILAVNNLSYVESTSNTYTFTNIKTDSNYTVYAYAVDKNKVKTNTYNYKYTSNYSLPVISKVETSKTTNSITATVTATKGTNNISKYYYSIDNGNTFIESTNNSYTFSSLSSNVNYRIIVKVMDTNGKYSNTYVLNDKLVSMSNEIQFTYAGTQYTAEKGMTFTNWANSRYNTFGYDIEDDTIIEENKSYENFDNEYIYGMINQTEGLLIEGLAEANLISIYKQGNYNDIYRVYKYFWREQTYDFDELYAETDDLSESQQNFLQDLIEQNLIEIIMPVFVNIDKTMVQPNSEEYYIVSISVELLKDIDIDNIKLVVFDEISKDFSSPEIETYNAESGRVTFRVLGNFAIGFFGGDGWY